MAQKIQNYPSKIKRAVRLRLYRYLRQFPYLGRVYLWNRRQMKKTGNWWRRNDRRYGMWWRFGNGAAVVLMVAAVVIPVAQEIALSHSYKLNADALKLVGKTDPVLTKQLTYDAVNQKYQFNKDAIKTDDQTNPLAQMQSQVGTASGSAKDKSLYALDVPTDFSKGVTYHDVNSDLSFSLVPQFSASPAKDVNGHLVFPLGGGNQAVYTLKNNGLKEDIVVPKAASDTMTFSYQLKLPKTLQAKALPDGSGAIGIYSADPTLFGNISYGSDKDRAAVEKARENADKNYLVFGLPSPVIKDTQGNEVGSARFELDGNNLTVVATGLSGQTTPITIDPSVVITSTSDFQTGNNEGNIDFSTSGQVTRGALTGGSVYGGWTLSSTSLTQNLERFGSFVYNGRLCYIGGVDKTPNTWNLQVYCSTINTANGSLSGSWSNVGNLTTGDMSCGSLAVVSNGVTVYNGTLYVIGNSCNGTKNLAYYATFKSNGSLNPWVALPNLPVTNDNAGITAYNGYIYMVGGGASSGVPPFYNTVYYASINADGSLGSWTLSSNTLLQTIGMGEAVAYNGYLYIVGGANGSGFVNDVEFAKLNSDGSVGTWQSTSAYATARYGQIVYAYNGYLYTVGGWGHNDTQYAQINANGTLAPWVASSSYDISAGEGQRYVGGAAYNGYIYVMGGRNEASTNSSSAIQYAKIDPPGQTASWATTTSAPTTTGFPKQTTNASAVVYNGYIYQIGGYTNAVSDYDNKVIYAALNANGTIGTWNTTSSLSVASGEGGVAIYNGYVYVMGGFTTGNTPTATVQYAPFNTNGTLGAWATTNSLIATSSNHTGTAYNGYLYMIGSSGGGQSSYIQYAPINSNGTVGTWVGLGNVLQTARYFEQVAVAGGYMYVVGGASTTLGNTLATVEYAPINSDGTLGTFQYTASLNTARDRFQIAVSGGYIYVVGGTDYTQTTDQSTVEYAPILSGGGLGSWQYNTALPATIKNSAVASYNGYVYSLGGTIAGSRSVVSYYAALNNGGPGTAGTWTTNGTDMSGAFPNGWAYGQAFAYQGYLYAVGGYDSASNRLSSVWSAPLNANGSVGSWTQQSSMNAAYYNAVVQIYNGYVYVYSGTNGSGNDTNTYEYAKLSSGGGLGSWSSDSTMNLSAGSVPVRYAAAGAAYNGYLYVLGGQHGATSYNDAYYAPINANGSLGTWVSTTAFTTARLGQTAFAYAGNIYVVGGRAGTSGSYLSDIQYAPLNSGNGTIGTWQYTNTLMQPRAYHTSAVVNGYVYVYGGTNSVGGLTDIEEAPILASGGLGAWEKSVGSAFTNARSNPAGAIYNGYIYMLGGYKASGPTYFTDIQYAPLDVTARIGRYSTLVDLGATVNVTSITYNGMLPTGVAAVTYRAAGSNGVFGSTGLASDVSGTIGCLGNLTGTRYVWIEVALDGSGIAMNGTGTFPDSSGAKANLTDFTINYSTTHPPPNIRLRLGQTLQTGNLSAFDTCVP